MRKLFSENVFFGNTYSLISQVDISEINIQQLKKCNSRNYEIDTVIVLLFILKLSSGANQKKKEKVVGAGNIFKKNRTRSLP